jgi:hypothetical protein
VKKVNPFTRFIGLKKIGNLILTYFMPIRSEINQAINPLIIEMEVDLESVFQKTIIGLAGVAVSITLNAMPITFHHLFPIFIALQKQIYSRRQFQGDGPT